MDRRNNRGGGDYGSGDGGGARAGGNRYDRQHDQQSDAGGGGGRWQNDMYDNTSQQPRRGSHGGGGGGYRERGGYQHDQRDHRGDGGGRGRSYGGGGGDRYGGGGGRRDCARGGGGGYRDYQNDNSFAGKSAQQQNWPTPGAAAGDAKEGGEGGGGVGGGGERWQKHAQALSGRSGGGGGGYNAQQRHGQQNQRPEASGEREQGRVCSIKESFGFVRCTDRPGDLFFHLTEAPPNINVGDEVDFFIGMGNRSGKDCALKLNLLPPGTVSSEIILDASFLGVIERDIRSYPSSMPSTHRANMMGRSRPQEYQQSEGLIKITGAAPPEEPPAADDTTAPPEGEVQPADATEGGDGTDASPETGAAVTGVDDAAGTSAPAATPETEEAVAVRSTQPAPAGDDKGDRAAPLGLQGAMVTYLVTDGLEEDAGSRFRRGDEVRFKVSQEKVTGRKRAVEVVLVRTNREKREGEQLQKLIDSGATKQQGVVKKLTHDYGFLRSLSCPETVYFNTAHVVQSREGERLRVGSQAEFWVVPDRTKDRRESFRALEIKILPPGTLTLEEETHKSLRGTVERAPTFPHRQSFGGGREGGGGGGGMQPGSARFAIPAPDTAEEGGEASPEGGEGPGAAPAKAISLVASLSHKELGKSQVPTLEVGDIIEADLWKSKLGGGSTQVKNVKLVSFGGERVEGVVKNLRDGGFGFIRPLGGTEDVYFRISDTCKNLPELREGSEVIFTQHESERGGDKKRATRVEVCTKGTLKVEVPLATGVSGVVTREAKGGGQGMITITDGNNLEMPAQVKFPKIAAQVREFAQSEDKELVFPSGLSAGERNAAHSLAAAEGLGHESRGDEGNRALHLWKPESEEEAVSIKEAESKRAEQRFNAIKERSKNGERSQSVPFSREDTASAKQDDKSQDQDQEKASSTNTQQEAGEEGVQGNGPPQRPSKSKLTQDFRTEKGFAGYAAAAQRGDLVTFDVVLNRGSMKRRATNVKVTKRASPQGSNANSSANSARGGGGGQEHGSGQDQEYMGVVSLVQLERHYGFIDVLDMDERVFFHLSEVLPDDNNSNNIAATPGGGGGGGGGSAPTDKDSSGDGVTESAAEVEGTPSTASGNGNAKPTPIIKRGQEVAFRIGQRQGKPLGLRVRKLRQGTLPTEESLPCRFVGVVVVPPRNVGAVDKEKDAMASAAGMEGVLVMLQEKSTATAELLPAPPAEGTPQGEDGAEIAKEESSAREAEKEASKAQRMLSLAGIRVASPPQDAAAAAAAAASSSLSSSIAEQAPSSSLLLNPSGVSSGKRRASRGGGGAAPKPPPRFSILCFLADTDGKGATAATAGGGVHGGGVTATETAAAGAVGSAVSYGRGDLVEFTVVARRGQRQQSHRVGDVTLVTKAAYPCLRGKVLQVDAKAGVAHVELLQGPCQDADQASTEKPKEEKGVDATAEVATTADAATAPPASSPTDSSTAEGASSRVFFLLKEMVGAAGPLRNGDEVDLMLPTPLPRVASQTKGGKSPGGVHAVGTVRVQDLKSLSGARQRLNINLRDSQKGPQVRMALGPDGNGFKQGHRASLSLYEKAAAVPPSTDTMMVTEEEEKEKEKVVATEAAVDAAETVIKEEQQTGET